MTVAAALCSSWGLASCGDGGRLALCGQIPDQGCPIGRGGTCEDATCPALYDCVAGAWKLVQKCAANTTTSSSSSSGAGGAGGGSCVPVTIDRSKEVDGCVNLQTPDCPAVAAESCTACEGCEDFFLCEQDAMGAPFWVNVAFCDASGRVVLTKP